MPVNEIVLRERYKIIREISRGGMGVVYLARDLLSNQPVAVKKSFFSGDSTARRGFEIEAKLLARLKHEGLPKVLDYFILENNFQALVMDYVEGETLADVLESGKQRTGRGISSSVVLNWALQILSILKYLHNFEPPVIHRDIKPNNIKINADGKIILLDFGLAKGSAVTLVGGMSGYSPIEQVNRTGTDPRSDIYALGTTLFHLLTDDYPLTALDRFRAVYGQNQTVAETFGKPAAQSVAVQRTVSEINPLVPREISDIVMQAMALMPEERFQTAQEMKAEMVFAKQKFERDEDDIDTYTPVETVVYREKNSPLFDDGEDFGHLINTAKSADGISENGKSLDETSGYEIRLNTTVASDLRIENFDGNRSIDVSSPESVDRENGFYKSELAALSNNQSRQRRKKIMIAAWSGFFIFLMSGLGILVWYLFVPPKQTATVSANSVVVVTADEKPKNFLDVSILRSGKANEKITFNDDYQFAEREKFRFLIKSSQDGFLYIVTGDNQSKASLAYPKPDQKNTRLQSNSETVFPLDNTFEFTKDTPSEMRVYFIVVPSREDDLAKQIQTTLEYAVEKTIHAENDVGKLLKQLDEIAGKTADTSDTSLVKIAKIQKKQ